MSKNFDDKLTCTIDKFEDSQAVLNFKLNHNFDQIKMPKRYLPKNIKEGETIYVKFFAKDTFNLEQKQLAKYMLDEIINNK